MKKPHILFVTEKYSEGNPAWLSNSHHNLFGSLTCSGLADYTNFYFEDHPQHLDDALITLHRRLNPDLTIVTILPSPTFDNNPTHKSLSVLADKGPLVFIWFDTVCKRVFSILTPLTQYATLQLILDNPYFIPDKKFLHLWTPQDTRIYNDPHLDRNIDVSFAGSVNGYNDRNEYLKFLCENSGANVHRDGGLWESNLTPEAYAKIMQQSKISLSFSKTREGRHQTKGRLWETTLCGSMLLEDVNEGTSLWFEPFKDYVPFYSNEDLVHKVNYYLNQPEKMAEIAANGRMKSEMFYSPKNWWQIVLNKCNIQIPN